MFASLVHQQRPAPGVGALKDITSLSFTLVNSRVFSVTPAFLATNPAEVKQGAFEGLRVLAEEEDLARRLAKSLNNKQKQSAILSDKAPDDILTKWDPTVDRKTFFPPKGVQYKDLNPLGKKGGCST